MATRKDFQQVVSAKRKYSVLEIIGNLIIWLAPLLMVAFVMIFNWNELWQQKWTFHLEFWVIVVMLITCFVYLKWGRRKIHEQYVADKTRAEKHSPLLVLGNALLNLMPIGLGILGIDVLSNLNEPIVNFLIVLLCIEAVGRLLLFIDSFHEEVYY